MPMIEIVVAFASFFAMVVAWMMLPASPPQTALAKMSVAATIPASA